MLITRAFFDPGLVFISLIGLISVSLLILTTPRPFVLRRLGAPDSVLVAGALLLAGGIAFAVTGERGGALAVLGAAAVVCTGIRLALPRLSAAGVLEMALAPIALICITPWSLLMLWEQQYPAWALVVLVAMAGLGALLFGFGFATKLANEALYTHARWSRPKVPLSERGGAGAPKVSIHLPCYAEPPEVVIETLSRLAELRYENFEVIVCDNNTPDEALWRPVQRYCSMLNARRPGTPFRFFHVSPLPGAKAGALNFCLQHTAADAEIIGVIDADYLAEPTFLSRLTGYFADEKVGFVQTPHDYLPDASAYQQMCYWEYMPPNKVGLAGINEYDCAYTIGTMCLFRKSAIERVGGWAEWCLTEDSEISIRVRALGYEGVYVNETFGRGLIPETYDDLKKQRFRWTAGPVQQLLVHWRLFLPAFMGNRSAIHGWAKLMEIHRSIAPLVGLLGVATGAAVSAAMFWLIVGGWLPQVYLPTVFWLALGLRTLASLGKLWQRYRLTGCASPRHILGAEIARVSLWLVKMTAALAPLTGRSIKWRRTPKFAVRSALLPALASTVPELCIAAALALLVYFPIHFRAALGGHVASIVAAGCLGSALVFLAAPLMAVLSEVRLRRAGAVPRTKKAYADKAGLVLEADSVMAREALAKVA